MSGQYGGFRSGAGRHPISDKIKVKARPLATLDSEWEQIQSNAKKAGMSVNGWMRQFGTDDNIFAVYQLAVKAYENGELDVSKKGYIGELAKLLMTINDR